MTKKLYNGIPIFGDISHNLIDILLKQLQYEGGDLYFWHLSIWCDFTALGA